MNRILRLGLWISLGALALGLGTYVAIPRILGPKITPIAVQRGLIVQTIVASGRVETPSRVSIGTQITGTVQSVHVGEGETVAASAVLMTLDSADARAGADQARAALQQAESRLVQLETFTRPSALQSLAEAEATSLSAEKQLDRIQTLTNRGYATRVQLDEAQRAFDVAQTQVRGATLQVANASAGGSEVDLATGAAAQAGAALRASEARLALTQIRSPIAATVIKRTVEAGSIVQPGAVLFELAPLGKKRLIIAVDERNLSLIALGQPAIASADSYPDQKFTAVITVINTAVDAQRGSVEVKLLVTEPPPYLKEDMTVSVDVEVARREDALSLSALAIRDGATRTPHVFLVVDGKVVDRPVTLGARGTKATEITSGVAMGDLAVAARETGILAGQKVRLMPAASPAPSGPDSETGNGQDVMGPQ